MSAGDLKAKFENAIAGATPKGTDTLRGNIRKRGSIPNMDGMALETLDGVWSPQRLMSPLPSHQSEGAT